MDLPELRYPFSAPTALDPPPEWARLREERPVARARMAGGAEVVLLTRYDDVRAMLSDPRFSRRLEAPDAARLGEGDGGVYNRPTSDGEAIANTGAAHAQWRHLVGRAFTAKRVAALAPRVEELTDRLVSDLVARDAPADLGSALGTPLPVSVICELLGVPVHDRDRFARWTDAVLDLGRSARAENQAMRADFHAYMTSLVAAKRADPRDDLLSDLVGQGLPDGAVVRTGQGLLVAGHETTANMIGKMVAMLLSVRDRWDALVSDPSLVDTAVEEALRFDANAGLGMPRYLSEPCEVAGTPLPAGTTAMCVIASANRDERHFEAADDMRLDRSPNPHLAFGVGPYSCLGPALARVELRTVLTVLLRRLPGLELAVDPQELRRHEGMVVGGIEEVPVSW